YLLTRRPFEFTYNALGPAGRAPRYNFRRGEIVRAYPTHFPTSVSRIPFADCALFSIRQTHRGLSSRARSEAAIRAASHGHGGHSNRSARRTICGARSRACLLSWFSRGERRRHADKS